MVKKLTINDIAKLAFVSKTTVSRVLNNDPKVSPETRQRIQEVIAGHNFRPSRAARDMHGANKQLIGIIVTRLTSNAENQALATMLPELYKANCEPIIVESKMDVAKVCSHLEQFQQRKVDGVILFAFSQLDQQLLEPWRHNLVVIARNYRDYSCIYYEDQRAVTLLLDKLKASGHEQIAYVGVSHDDITTGKLRHQAYLDFCCQENLPVNDLLGDLSYASGYNLAKQLDFEQVSAVVCATDTLAIGVVKWLHERSLTNVTIAGIGNNPLLRFLFPQVITVDLGFELAGKQAAKQLFKLLNHQEVSCKCIQCKLATSEML